MRRDADAHHRARAAARGRGVRGAAYPQLFEQLERWFGIPYPYEKLDHIAIPLTVGFAMENAGLITYGAPILLAKPGAAIAAIPAQRREHRRARDRAPVVRQPRHARRGGTTSGSTRRSRRWIAEKIVDRWRPDYERGAARVTSARRRSTQDALASARRIREPIIARGDIRNAFDSITYQKGATVIGMFEALDRRAAVPARRAALPRARAPTATRRPRTFSTRCRKRAGCRSRRRSPPSSIRTACRRSTCARLCDKRGARARADAAPADDARVPQPSASQRWQIPVCARYRRWRAGEAVVHAACATSRECCPRPRVSGVRVRECGRPWATTCRTIVATARPAGASPRVRLSVAEYTSLLYDLRALVRPGAVTPRLRSAWVRDGAASSRPERAQRRRSTSRVRTATRSSPR